MHVSRPYAGGFGFERRCCCQCDPGIDFRPWSAQVRREKVEIEIALEQEQEFVVNRLRAELDRRQTQTKQLEDQIEQVVYFKRCRHSCLADGAIPSACGH